MSAVFEESHLIAKIETTVAQTSFAHRNASADVYQRPMLNAARGAEISAAIATVDEFAAMDEDWDGYGALRISRAASENAKRTLQTLLSVAPCPDLSPNPNGTVSMEWETEAGYAVVEIGNSRFSFYIKVGTYPPYSVAGNANEISVLLGQQISGSLFAQARSGSHHIASVIALPDYVRPAY